MSVLGNDLQSWVPLDLHEDLRVHGVVALISAAGNERGRGFLQFYGAGRTGRFAGRLVQVQNPPRNYLPDLDEARALVRSGTSTQLSCCIRRCRTRCPS